MPAIRSASSRLGVNKSHIGISSRHNASMALSSISWQPEVEIITGSRMMFLASCFFKHSAITPIIDSLTHIPIFIESGRMSSKMASNSMRKCSTGVGKTSLTALVFCAVRAVIIDIPYTPSAENVFKSACTPAPPLQSDPAIVNALW